MVLLIHGWPLSADSWDDQANAFAEAGYPGFEALNWYAFVAPAKTPAPLLDRWNVEIVKVLNDPGVKDALEKHGLTPQPTTRAGLASFMRAESEKWGKVVRERKISAE